MVSISNKVSPGHHQVKPVLKRSLATFTADIFNHDLENRLDDLFQTNSVTNENNLQELFNNFHSIFTQVIDIHAPLKKLTRKQKRLQHKPWITKGNLISIKRKQKMHKTHYRNGSSVDKFLYKQLSNTLTRIKNLSKRVYYHCKIDEFKNNPKNTWDILRTILSNNPKSSLPNTIRVDDTNISNPKIIADKFNTHFANVGKLLAASLNAYDTDFLTHLKSPCPSSVYLYPTSPQEIIRIINSFHLNKACGYDDISPFLLKTAAHVIAYPLSIILNHCISLGVFPNQLKVAKVIPVYKSGPLNDLQNLTLTSLVSLKSLKRLF